MKDVAEQKPRSEDFADLKRHLFYETSHSPALADLVGYDQAKGIIDFCFIANPYYPTAAMLQELQRQLPSLIKSYPSSNPLCSQEHLASVLGVDPQRLIIGNGATELICLIDAFLVQSIAIPVPTFGEYIEKMRDNEDAKVYPLDPQRKYRLDPHEYLRWVRERNLKALLIINPGNPTGQFTPLDETLGFLEHARDMELVIVDESFIDFSGDPVPSLLHFADRFPNLLIVRSMSKHCGVPGLRLGYCYSSNDAVLHRLAHFVPTWNLNALAQYFLSQLPATNDAYHDSRRRLMADVRLLYEGLESISWIEPYPTGANFVLFKIKGSLTASALQAQLLAQHRMYVRDCSNKLGMDAFHIRVASQGREKDSLLVEALRSMAL